MSLVSFAGNKGEEAEAGEDNADADADAQQQPDALHNSHPFGFPLSLVKRVMCMDPEVVRISGKRRHSLSLEL